MIGIGYLLPTDLCFSVWFFYLFWKVQKVVACILRMEVSFDDPYIRQQEAGGVFALVLMLLWASRGYLKQVWLRILDRKSGLDDSQEPISYRAAALGAAAGFVLLTLFMKRIGMSPLLALIAFAIYFLIAVVVARIRAEMGPPVHDMPFTPDYLITTAAGVGRLSNGDLLGLAYFNAFHGAYRSHPLPIGLEGMKMAAVTRSSQRKVFWAVMLAAALGGRRGVSNVATPSPVPTGSCRPVAGERPGTSGFRRGPARTRAIGAGTTALRSPRSDSAARLRLSTQ